MDTPRWSYEIPSVPGWYWWQPDPGAKPRPVELIQDRAGNWFWQGVTRDTVVAARVLIHYQSEHTITGRWLGPIEPPMAHEAWRSVPITSPDTDFDAYNRGSVDSAWTQPIALPVCQYPGCFEPAICRSGNFSDRLVCAEHLAIVNGTEAYRVELR